MNTRTNEYAGSLYDTPAQTTRAAVIDWVTAGGNNGTPEACAGEIAEDLDAFAHELADNVRRGHWRIPNVEDADDPQVARELLLDFVEEFGS